MPHFLPFFSQLYSTVPLSLARAQASAASKRIESPVSGIISMGHSEVLHEVGDDEGALLPQLSIGATEAGARNVPRMTAEPKLGETLLNSFSVMVTLERS